MNRADKSTNLVSKFKIQNVVERKLLAILTELTPRDFRNAGILNFSFHVPPQIPRLPDFDFAAQNVLKFVRY